MGLGGGGANKIQFHLYNRDGTPPPPLTKKNVILTVPLIFQEICAKDEHFIIRDLGDDC